MQNYKFTVDGMDCQSCRTIVEMVIAESGFEDQLQKVELAGDSKGEVVMNNLNEGDVENVTQLINNAGHYTVAQVETV